MALASLEAGALALCIVLGVWAGHARAQPSSTRPVIAILPSGDAGQLKCTDGERLELIAAVAFPPR